MTDTEKISRADNKDMELFYKVYGPGSCGTDLYLTAKNYMEEKKSRIGELENDLRSEIADKKTLETMLARFDEFNVWWTKEPDQRDGLAPPCPLTDPAFDAWFEQRDGGPKPVEIVPKKPSWFRLPSYPRRGGKGKAKYTRKPRGSKIAKGIRKKVRGGKLYPAKTYKKGLKEWLKYTRRKRKTKTKKANRL